MGRDHQKRGVFLLRLSGFLAASIVFGLIAARGIAPWNAWWAAGLGLLFAAAFIGGAGYRIIRGVIRMSLARAPASWAGGAAGSAVGAIAIFALFSGLGHNGAFVLLGYGMAINIAYVPAKQACLRAGCCAALPERRTPADVDLRIFEVLLTMATLLAGATLGLLDAALGASVAIGGHLAICVVSLHLRNYSTWVWPSFRQLGPALTPLTLLLAVSIGSAI